MFTAASFVAASLAPIRCSGRACHFVIGLVLASSLVAAAAPLPVPSDHAERMKRGLDNFQNKVRPLLTENCLKCHGGEKTKGGLDMTTRESLLAGGTDGPVVVPFEAAKSRTVKLIRHEEEPHMPDKKPRLPEEAIARITAWIDDGAPYDKPLVESGKLARNKPVISEQDRNWWSFKPLLKVEPPDLRSTQHAAPNPIDHFILAKASAKGFTLSQPADKRTLIRRAFLDLLGLPPSPQEIEAFLHDPSSEAWPQLIDRLLASSRYGERWARHWLDVARFAESSGFEHDYDREGAFYYRDFVIKALNADMPYDQFVRWQMAGDEFEPENPLALTATGFLGAGVFPTQITANEVERTRYDALDDMLSTSSLAFLGLTVGCARCHDHKYDPIPTSDYYRMLSTFTTTVRSVIDLDVEPEKTRERMRKWESEHAPLVAELASYDQSLQPKFDAWFTGGAEMAEPPAWILLDLTNLTSKAGATFKKLDDGSYLVEGKNGDRDEYAFVGSTSSGRITGLRLDALAHPSMKNGGPGRADNGNIGLSRIRVFVTPAGGSTTNELKLARAEADFQQNTENLSIVGALDNQPNTGWALDPQFGKDHSALFTFAEPVDFGSGASLTVKLEFQLNARHNIGRPRLSVTQDTAPSLKGEVLPARVAGLLQQLTGGGRNSGARNDAGSLADQALVREAQRSTVGGTPAAAGLTRAERAILFDWWRKRDDGWRERTARVEEHLKKQPDGRTKVLICGEGNPPLRMHTQGADFFNETYLLKRGNTDLKDGVARPGFLQVLMRGPDGEEHWRWQPPANSKFSGRRRSFANWLTDTDAGAGALLARVVVNRLWQHHFGQGIVATPNDFGRTGTLPTHPELLDWLAGELIRGGWKLKPMHKLLMTSATYLQSTALDPAKQTVDPTNELFVRRLPRRLEGEVIRDCMLGVSGALDPTMFGKGTKDERSRRRSIYFMIKRSELIGSMVAFDQPEPLVSQGMRPTTTVAPQALLLMNGPQVREWAEAFAKRVETEAAAAHDFEPLVARTYALALGRAPTTDEARDAVAFLNTQTGSYTVEGKNDARSLALADFCQVMFGLNEFAYER